jgi:hypothetical protein
MEYIDAPKRVVLRFHVKHELKEATINQSFFALFKIRPTDYYSHLMAPNYSSKMHIVLDLLCKTNPKIDRSKLPYEVYTVIEKDGEL